ncbi:MAG: hypothetical protein MN733_09575 [Nitrososphaera sp.]|nr:hypothetical protein [Nitrososphaera sp.]
MAEPIAETIGQSGKILIGHRPTLIVLDCRVMWTDLSGAIQKLVYEHHFLLQL